MVYTKKTWVTERAFTTDFQNIEDGLDRIHNLDEQVDGIKTFTSDPVVSKVDAGIRLDDTDTGGVEFIIRSLDGKVEIYDQDALQQKIADIIAHAHSGGVDGAQLDHADLIGIGVDQHHAKDHAASHIQSGADPLSVGIPVDIGASNAEGSATNFPRRDHVHAHPSGLGATLHHSPAAPTDLYYTNSEGSANTFARSDHRHRGLAFLDSDVTSVSGSLSVSIPLTNWTRLLILFDNEGHSQNGSGIRLRFNNDSGNNYAYRNRIDTSLQGSTAGVDAIRLIENSDRYTDSKDWYEIWIVSVGGNVKQVQWHANHSRSLTVSPNIVDGCGFYNITTDLTSIQIFAPYGTFGDARMVLYGTP